jgi:hypothetical protein
MLGFKIEMGILSLAIAVVAFGIYIYWTLYKETEPHPMTWFGFGVLTLIGSLIQWANGAGPGSWAMSFTAITCFVLCFLSLRKRFRRGDPIWKFSNDEWAMFIIAFLVFVIYQRFPGRPNFAAIVATTADLLFYYPTLKQAWAKPDSECATAYFFNGIKFIPAIAALEAYGLATVVYPAAMIGINLIFCVFLGVRRWQSRTTVFDEAGVI